MPRRVRKQGPRLRDLDALLVEDDVYAARTLKAMLRALGVPNVRLVTSVKDALFALRARPPDVVLLDASLQGMPAHQVVEELQHREIPFVVVTGYSREMLPTAFAKPPLLRKPVTLVELEESLSVVTEADHAR